MIRNGLTFSWRGAGMLAGAIGATLAPETAFAAAQLYRVEVGGTDTILLERVRAFEPEAFVRPDDGVIQAGLFGDAGKANDLADTLQRSGLPAQIVPIDRGAPSPAAVAAAPAGDTQYRVVAENTSPETLGLVRALEPQAFVRRGEGTIQAGVFKDAQKASQLVDNLGVMGVDAQVVAVEQAGVAPGHVAPGAVPATPTGTVAPGTELTFVPLEAPTVSQPIEVPPPPPGSTNSSASSNDLPPAPQEAAVVPSTLQEAPRRGSRYYAIVPSRRKRSLPQLETQVRRRLNAPSIPVRLRNAPYGPHVSVGPFASLEEAQKWGDLLEERGLDTRVIQRGG